MAHLPREAVTLTGGCYCKAIRYSIQVPAWDDRPAIPGALDTPISATQKVQTRMPLIDIDHCNCCRQVSGALVQAWFIGMIDWIEWDILLKDQRASDGAPIRRVLSTVEAVGPIEEGKDGLLTHLTRFNRTDQATRTFCSQCGTHLAYISHKRLNTPAAFVDITLGSLDLECLNMVKPDRHTWWSSGVDWVKNLVRRGDGGFNIIHGTGDVKEALADI